MSDAGFDYPHPHTGSNHDDLQAFHALEHSAAPVTERREVSRP